MSEEIDAMVQVRRQALEYAEENGTGPSAAGDLGRGVWGLALSGGGIRSATFCFGLLQALASKKMLPHFDLLSTVSGGGYIGAMLGRMLQRARHPGEVRAIFEALGRGSDSWFAWWLRANGRYLVPLGAKDRLFALAVYVRNVIGIHLELALIGLVGGVVLAAADVWLWYGMREAATHSWHVIAWAREWIVYLPTPWLVLVPLAGLALTLCWSYWIIGWAAERSAVLVALSSLLLVAFVVSRWPQVLVVEHWVDAWRPWWMLRCALGGISALWLPAILLALAGWASAVGTYGKGLHRRLRSARDVTLAQDAARSLLTFGLASVLRTMGIVLLIGLLDRAAWWLAVEHQSWVVSGYVLAVAGAVLRVVLSPVSGVRHSAGTSRHAMTGLSILGRVLTFALFAWWVAVVHRASLVGIFKPDQVDFRSAVLPLAVILCCAGGYLLLTGTNIRFLNLSSLHGFYRARLVRSYLGASNPLRFADTSRPPHALGAIGRLPVAPEEFPIKSVGEVDSDDDVPMRHYAPHRNGGPVHLMSMCLNETTDPRGGLFNQDRRGRLVTVGPQAVLRVGRGLWQQMSGAAGLTLGSWMAISGAAVSPGLGSQTRGGISSLVMFAGARLGYWWDSAALKGDLSKWRSPWVKARGVLRETFGIFGGPKERDWFLTDGGHFENTGAYALLAERAHMILIADCGADPAYRFGDIENLVRKARIDLQAEIDFLKPRSPNAGAPTRLIDRFGSLNDLASNESDACFALARVTYRSLPSGPEATGAERPSRFAMQDPNVGYLILVKPNMCKGLPVDLANFKADHPEFPQQGTADQFFDESQWESYFQLGRTLGEMFTLEELNQVVADVNGLFTRDDGSPIVADPDKADDPIQTTVTAPAGRLPARLATTAISSIGFGAAAAAGLAAWQAIDAYKVTAAQQAKDERAALKELTDLWAKAGVGQGRESPSQSIETVDALAATLSRVADTLCPSDDAGWFNRSPLAVEVLAYTLERCDALPVPIRPASCTWLARASNPFAQGNRASCLMAGKTLADQVLDDEGCTRYWAYDYRFHSVSKCAHPNDPVLLSRKPQEEHERELREPIKWIRAVGPADVRRPSAPATEADVRACAARQLAPSVYQSEKLSEVREVLMTFSTYGIAIAATQDLRLKAAQLGRSPPTPVTTTTVRYPEGSMECAQALGRLVPQAATWRLEPAINTGVAQANVLEVLFALPEKPAGGLQESTGVRPSGRPGPTPRAGGEDPHASTPAKARDTASATAGSGAVRRGQGTGSEDGSAGTQNPQESPGAARDRVGVDQSPVQREYVLVLPPSPASDIVSCHLLGLACAPAADLCPKGSSAKPGPESAGPRVRQRAKRSAASTPVRSAPNCAAPP